MVVGLRVYTYGLIKYFFLTSLENKRQYYVNTPRVCIWAGNFNGRLILGLISLTIGYFKLGKGSWEDGDKNIFFGLT